MRTRNKVETNEKKDIAVALPVIIFKEEGVTICYCPALDLAGYGNTEKEAVSSYKYVLGEYIDHTSQKNTLKKDLKRLGWQIKSNLATSIIPPPVSKLLENNTNFRRVFDKFDYKKLNTNVHFPAVLWG